MSCALIDGVLAKSGMVEPGDTQALRDDFSFAVYAAANAMSRACKSELEAFALTYPQYLVLLALWERDGRMVREIAEALFLDAATVTPILKRLEAGGLVTRLRSADDERRLSVRLTEQGRALQARMAHVPALLREATGLDATELKSLLDQLRRLRQGVDSGAESQV